jgi:hypothetical protein
MKLKEYLSCSMKIISKSASGQFMQSGLWIFRNHFLGPEEVIIHELLHLKYPNHGKMFRLFERVYSGKEK